MHSDKKLKALISGHTGATGKALLDALIDSPDYESIVTVGRKENISHKKTDKLTQIIVPDMTQVASLDLNEIGDVDAAFCCLGVGYKEYLTGNMKQFRLVDFVMATEFAKLAKSSGASFFSLITMEGVSPESSQVSSRIKGEAEAFVKTLGFERIAYMHPLFVNREADAKWYERVISFNGLFGTKVMDIARSMAWAGLSQTEPVVAYSVSEMRRTSALFADNYLP